MPYRSEKQRRFMHAKHPDIAARWDAEYGSKIVPKKGKKSGKGVQAKGKAGKRKPVQGRRGASKGKRR